MTDPNQVLLDVMQEAETALSHLARAYQEGETAERRIEQHFASLSEEAARDEAHQDAANLRMANRQLRVLLEMARESSIRCNAAFALTEAEIARDEVHNAWTNGEKLLTAIRDIAGKYT